MYRVLMICLIICFCMSPAFADILFPPAGPVQMDAPLQRAPQGDDRNGNLDTEDEDSGLDCDSDHANVQVCGTPHEGDIDGLANWPCSDVWDDNEFENHWKLSCTGANPPGITMLTDTIYGKHCPSDDIDYIPVIVPPRSRLVLKFHEKSSDGCFIHPTSCVEFERYDQICGNGEEEYRNDTLQYVNTSYCNWAWRFVEPQNRRAPGSTESCRKAYVITTTCFSLDEGPVVIDTVRINPAEGLPHCECITACPGDPVLVQIGPGLSPQQIPVGHANFGCEPDEDRVPIPGECDDDCFPTIPYLIDEIWYDAETGTFNAYIGVLYLGCFCLCIEDLLDVELVSFDATARDGEIELHWATASETEGSMFEIMRDGSLMHRMNGEGSATGGSYSWIDNSVSNGNTYEYSLVAVEAGGQREVLGTVNASPDFGSALIAEYALHQNYPNPFNPETNIAFDLPEASYVQLKVFDLLGRNVASLISRTMESGRHVVTFNAADMPSGLYICRLEAGSFVSQKKMMLMK